MPDWKRYRATFIEGDLKAQNLKRLHTMEDWVGDLPYEQCLTAAQTHFAGWSADELRPWYQLSRSLFLKYMHEAGIEGPEAAQKQKELAELYQAGKASAAQQETFMRIAKINQISLAMSELTPACAQLFPGTIAGNATWRQIQPLTQEAMTVDVTPAYVNADRIQKLKTVVAKLQQIATEVSPDNTSRPLAYYFLGEVARQLGDACANSADFTSAVEWYGRSSQYFEEASEPEKAAAARQKSALAEYKATGDVDRIMQRILGPLMDPSHVADPVATAIAYADLANAMQSAGDQFGAGQQAARSAAAFESLGFLDPQASGADQALDSWVSRSCDLAPGKAVFRLLMRVCEAYSAIYSGRVAQFVVSDPKRADNAYSLAMGMRDIQNRISAETTAAQEELQSEIAVYFAPWPSRAQPGSATENAPSNGDKEYAMAQLDEGFLKTRQLANAQFDAHESMRPAFALLERMEPAVDALGMPLYQAKWLLSKCYVHVVAGEKEAALKAAEDSLSAMAQGRELKLANLLEVERPHYLEALNRKVQMLMMLGRHQEGLSVCLGVIEDFEKSRALVNAPLQQSSIVQQAFDFYRGAAFAAWKLDDHERLLKVIELVKAHAAVQNSRNRMVESPEHQQLARRFTELTAAMEDADRALNQAPLANLRAQRRDVANLMAIAAARTEGAAAAPEISIPRLQECLADDEGLIGYFFLSAEVFLILRVDRVTFEVERVVCSSDQIDRVNELLEAIEGLDSTGPLILGPYIQAVGEILLTPAARQFIESKGRIIISPHHQLHLFPFHAASWDGRFLIERCAVRYVPNFTSLLVQWSGKHDGGVFSLGISRFDAWRQPWPELPNTERQAGEVCSIYRSANRDAESLIGNDASVSAFRNRASNQGLSGYSVLHMATHGTSVFASDTLDEPMESKLVLADGAIDGTEIATLHLPAHVAVLSACNSGQRAIKGRGMNELPGDDIFGLQAALFQAGVHTVLGALWPVETNAAYAVTTAFHRNYVEGDRPEDALRKALLALRHTDDAADAFVWAPFFLSSLGNSNIPTT